MWFTIKRAFCRIGTQIGGEEAPKKLELWCQRHLRGTLGNAEGLVAVLSSDLKLFLSPSRKKKRNIYVYVCDICMCVCMHACIGSVYLD